MRRIPVESSCIKSVGKREDVDIIEIEFNNGPVYRYLNTGTDVFTAILNAESHGKFFCAHVRNSYPFQRVVNGIKPKIKGTTARKVAIKQALRYFYGLSFRRIAALTNTSLWTVHGHVRAKHGANVTAWKDRTPDQQFDAICGAAVLIENEHGTNLSALFIDKNTNKELWREAFE